MVEKIRFSDAIDAYLTHMEARGAAANTVKNHRNPLNRALELWGNIYVVSITPKHIDDLFADAGWTGSTRNLYLSTLRGGFFAWCRRARHIPRDSDPTEGWRNVRVEVKPKLWIDVTEFNDLLEACDNARDRAVCAIGLFTFIRGSEISLLKVSSVDFDNSMLRVFRPKTQEWDDLPISTELERELRRWVAAYEREAGPLQQEWLLVPARSTLPMTYDRALGKLQPTGEPARLKPLVPLGKPYECVKRPLARIGYSDKGSGAHTLRRSGARALFQRLREEGYDGALRRTSAMLGHKSVLMTERYLGLQLEKTQRNELLAGLPMFPGLAAGTLEHLREVG
jgi:integrase